MKIPINDYDKTKPSLFWKTVKKEDIGEHYEVVEDGFQIKTTVVPEFKIKNKFLSGYSPFITFEVKPKTKKVKEKRKAPINAESVLPKDVKAEFAKKLKANIEAQSKFFLEQVLPITLAIDPASSRVQDYTEQLFNERIGLPVGFMQKKTALAVQMRLIREIIKKFGLTKDEAKILYTEYLEVNQ